MTAEERLLMEDETKEQRWNPRMQGFAHHEARTGYLEGEMALPRHDAYTVEVTVTKRNPMVRTRRPAVLRRLHAIDATRFQE